MDQCVDLGSQQISYPLRMYLFQSPISYPKKMKKV